MLWLKIAGCLLCALYTVTFLILGAMFAQEMWHDRHRELLYKISPIRQIGCVSIFFIAAAIFGVFSWLLFPL